MNLAILIYEPDLLTNSSATRTARQLRTGSTPTSFPLVNVPVSRNEFEKRVRSLGNISPRANHEKVSRRSCIRRSMWSMSTQLIRLFLICEHSRRILTIAMVLNQIYACLCVESIKSLVYCIRRIEFNFRRPW